MQLPFGHDRSQVAAVFRGHLASGHFRYTREVRPHWVRFRGERGGRARRARGCREKSLRGAHTLQARSIIRAMGCRELAAIMVLWLAEA